MVNKTITTSAAVILLVSIVAWPKFLGIKNERACTMEAKLCPDGSYVGRTGPNCEFAPCPGEDKNDSGIMCKVLLGPICPVMRIPPDLQCADKPYQTKLVVTTPDGAQVIKEFASDASGSFRVGVSPGQYAIRSAAAANILPFCNSRGEVEVTARKFTETTVYCDTGIR